MRKILIVLGLLLCTTAAFAANLTSVGVVNGVPNSGTGTASTLDGLMNGNTIADLVTAINTLNTTAGSSIAGVSGSVQSSSNPMGWVNINQTTKGTTNGVSQQAYAAGGWSGKFFIAANSDNATNLKSSAGIVHGFQIYGIGSSPAWLKFYDKATTPTCGSDTVVAQYLIPAASTAANGAGNNAVVIDRQFSNGISYCVVTGIALTDDTAPSANLFVVNIGYN